MGIKLSNNANATLATGINSSATSITLTSGQGARFPSLSGGDYFYATLIDTSNNLEIVKCTARSTDVLTVVRAQESTTARAYNTGDRIEIRITAQTFVDATTFNPTPAEVSDEANTSTGYFALPSGTTAQRPGSPTAGMQRWNTTLEAMEYYNGTSWSQQFVAQYVADYLVVAGGGAGGNYGGGGGAGGYLAVANSLLSAGTAYTITVGGGGAGATGSPRYGGNGTNSSFVGTGLNSTAIGGGGGGGNDPSTTDAQSGRAGGSGGGASNQNASGTYGAGTSGQGNRGGSATGSANSNRGGGGGGASAVGVDGSSTGNGGAGTTWLNGTTYAGGGGGGGSNLTNSVGGAGGGGGYGSTGTANTGGGGGSGNDNAASSKNGGSGVVIVRYAGTTQRGSGGTVTTSGGYTYHTFNSSGTYTA
jgi:hypothetical protein